MTTDKNNSPVTVPMWWDGGDRAITAREKATIEEHGPSCYTIPLLPAQAVDPEDPWRGLYLPARLPAPSEYGDLFHPDIPRWPDDREDALDKLVHAQGFDFHIVAGDFTEAALEDADELYWQEMRTWNPEAPEGEWRLAWKGDTEDGPYAWFVRPMALRPEPSPLAAHQPGAQEPERRAPVQGYHGATIPWRVHGLAWEAYARKHPGQDAEKIASRGGFAVQEMDVFLPGWRDMAEGPPAQGIDLAARPMDTAPRDGTMVRLLVQFTEHATEDTTGPAWTIGANNGEHDGGDLWCFAGWCWTHDHFTEGKGTPVGWLPLIDDQRDAAPGVGNG